jgi:predicted  nucleic acid-binding Zn-ribbon protein
MGDDRVDDAADELYAADPGDFMTLRKALADAARTGGDAQAAKRIGGLRKPTASAAIVNQLAHTDEQAMSRLTDLSRRLREAQDELDAAALRELTGERRKTVDELTRRAVRAAPGTPSSSVQDEVRATLDAAVADPEVAGRLGRLERAERWSGFGFDAGTGPPQLTVVRGGKDAPARRTGEQTPAKKVPAAELRRLQRAVERAQTEFDHADAELSELDDAEHGTKELIRRLTDQLAEVQAHLEDEKRHLEDTRRQLKRARTARREARAALDRALRQAERAD